MAQESLIPQQLMTGALLHFESGVPICDLDVNARHKERMARVDHVWWLWKQNPFLDTFALFKQLVKQGAKQYADVQSAWRAAQKDQRLFEFVRDHVAPPSRRDSEAKVRLAAEQAIRIGLETDNPVALVKGGKLLSDVAGLDKPESEQADMAKVLFTPPVITTSAHEVDDTKDDLTDQQSLDIMHKYNAHIDEKRQLIEQKVATMEAERGDVQMAAEVQHAEREQEQ